MQNLDKRKWFLLLGIPIVVISVIVSVVTIYASGRQNPDTPETTTEETTLQDTTEETTEETTQPPETTAPPATESESTKAPAPPNIPTDAGGHKSANFKNVLFIGDSRTVGLKDYANLGAADVFAESGLNVFRLFKDAVNVPGRGKITLEGLLAAKQYDKIYVMLGINEIGYNLDKVIQFYGRALDSIQGYQPGATIYIEANLMIQKSRSDRDSVYNNANMQYLNDHMAAFADGSKRVFVDVNPLFTDGAGNLAAQYAYDDFHLLGNYYAVWADWLYENTCE